mmetsp:Transcript_96664/g.306724  ORF Transcript_96664/g.306724 Transcript_96664/m.306724 type:complete len:230 (+) Transcript_96664:233-922(+)
MDSSAGCVLWGSRKRRQSSWVPTKRCAEEPLSPLARPWNSGSAKQLSMPRRYSEALKASRPKRRQTSKTTASHPPSSSSSTVSLMMAPSTNTAHCRRRRKAGAVEPSVPDPPRAADATAWRQWPTACAADVGPNQVDGSLPRRCWPAATRACRENGAAGQSRKHDTISRYGAPWARSRSTQNRHSLPRRNSTKHCASIIWVARNMQPQPESLAISFPLANRRGTERPLR